MAPLRRGPRPDAPLDTEALKGERVTIYELDGEGWAWGQLTSDGYVGWLPDAALGGARADADAQNHGLRTFRFPGPCDQNCRRSKHCLGGAWSRVGPRDDTRSR